MRSYRRALGQVFSRIRGRTPLLVEIQLEAIPMNPQGPGAPYLPSNGLAFERLFCGTLRTTYLCWNLTDNHSLRPADRRQIDCTTPPLGVADDVDRRGRIVTPAQARTVKHPERQAIERQVGARQPGKT